MERTRVIALRFEGKSRKDCAALLESEEKEEWPHAGRSAGWLVKFARQDMAMSSNVVRYRCNLIMLSYESYIVAIAYFDLALLTHHVR